MCVLFPSLFVVQTYGGEGRGDRGDHAVETQLNRRLRPAPAMQTARVRLGGAAGLGGGDEGVVKVNLRYNGIILHDNEWSAPN